jgi:RNA polymerase-binding transcription factor DksA
MAKSAKSSPKSEAVKKGTAKKGTAKKGTAKKGTAKKGTAKKGTAKKGTAKKGTAKKAVARKAPAKRSAANKTAPKPAVKAAGKNLPAKTSPAKQATGQAKAKTAATSPTPPKKKPVQTPFDKKFLDEMKAALVSERSRYVTSAELLKAEADSLVEGREPGDVQFDEESGDGDTVAVERERDLALSAQARAAVDDIDEALDRLAGGTYGVCLVSEKPIPKERLRAIPWASERVEHKAGGFGLR